MENSISEIQSAVNEILNVKSLVRRKKKTREEKKKELFITIVHSIEQIISRQNLLYLDLNLDLTKYDEAFLDVIDSLLILHFGKGGADLISYYLWERLSPDGEINPLVDIEGKEVYLENAEELWNLLILIDGSDEQK